MIPHFYLKAVTDINDAVQYFAVTIRDETCKPVFKSPDYPVNETSFQLTLGANTFSDIPGLPEYMAGCLGAHNISYYETRWLGNPGHYKHFGFGFNQAGYLSNNAGAYLSVLANTPHLCPGTSAYTEQDLVALNDFRTKVAFNTYAVSAPFVTIEDYAGSNLGVDYYQVRALNM